MNAIMNFMKRNYKIILAVLAISAALCSFMSKKEKDPEKDKTLLDLITFVIEKAHYNPMAIDDNFSKGVYKDYLDALDPSKRFFVQADIDEFKTYESQIDDMIHNRDLTFFKLTYERLQKRMREVEVVYKSLNEKPYDFTIDETINLDSDKNAFAKNYSELKNRWRLQMKLSILATVVEKEKQETAKKEKDPKYVVKTFSQLEKEARETTIKTLKDYFDFIKESNENDWFVAYVNAIVTQFDPHTYYFAPDEKEKFDVSMSGKLEGIGARLQKTNDFTEISELISGGPAWRGKELEPGDLVLKVAQGSNEPVDVTGMRLDEVVKKIKGPKGTEVRLTVKKVDGSIVVIPIIRDIVEIEETYAKSSIVEKNGVKYGVIYLPKFYIDFENNDNRDAAKDVAIEIEKLKKDGVEGIVMDLRDNGGGSLKTVVDITGLFIDEGPVVQIKSAKGKKEVLSDHDPKIQWDGPLVVMINNFSASASEIFAAAIQDYKRGVIIGSKQSYGKGTVQNVIDLNQFVANNAMGDFGALKTTTQKFYRINGGSTQMEGVSSDITMPDRYSYIKIGERDVKNAMPWDKIDEASFEALKSVNNFETVVADSQKRILENAQFKLIDENAKWINDRKEDNVISLNLTKFKAEQTSIEEGTKKFKAISKFQNSLKFTSLPQETELIKKDSLLGQKRKDWHESLSKDAYVEEAINVLSDIKKPALASKDKVLNIKNRKDKLVKS
ncbi:peptidase S41 [Flavobacterium psychrophilum]|uniref:Carboxy terminal-processing peptidase n=5 Tax=Flavobacterium psychrophilum TaxID=96345 RepID=A0A076NWM4_FLAPS|nr:carboxy terminal-processing peptidase [Flavobacterium psychrophilum]AIG31058.1 peptidase S41 [Flavobacterium psychrophilum]AIG33335.1 peptidase S41 [Flavobacterium psychrophilum]AIG35485.1 peptidase S41 [Flavobacterium psychrophilum]AIG37846.1 peptidase S41 [Flavobacterium psychrophilum]AIG40117.1 peptidase S41 [Flavobacterium psychrophilum]